MGTYLENISVDDVRNLTGLSSSDISDSNIRTIISGCVSTLNNDIQIRHEDWMVTSIDGWRENKIDGSNTTFYVPDDKRPIGDYADDGVIDENDVVAYVIEPNGSDSSYKKTSISVSSIDDSKYGKITLATAPSTDAQLYLSWSETPLEMETPHPLIKRAIIQLASAICYSKLDVGKISKFKVGKVSVMKQSDAFEKYMRDYERTRFQILSKIVKRKNFK